MAIYPKSFCYNFDSALVFFFFFLKKKSFIFVLLFDYGYAITISFYYSALVKALQSCRLPVLSVHEVLVLSSFEFENLVWTWLSPYFNACLYNFFCFCFLNWELKKNNEICTYYLHCETVHCNGTFNPRILFDKSFN